VSTSFIVVWPLSQWSSRVCYFYSFFPAFFFLLFSFIFVLF
jgi:hypothetical protein